MTKLYVVDTNCLLDNIHQLNKYNIVILSHVLRELDKHKISKNYNLAYKARQSVRYIKEHKDELTFDINDYDAKIINEDNTYQDNNILTACKMNGYGIITNDLLLQLKCKAYGIDVVELDNNFDDEYKGTIDVYLDLSNSEDQKVLAEIYELPEHNIYKLVENQYLIIWDKSKPTYDEDMNATGYTPIDKFKWVNERLQKLKYKNVKSKFLGTVKPINVKQEPLFDLLQNKNITIKSCVGTYGTGKDFVMLSHAVEKIEKGEMDKLVWVRNSVELENAEPLGILPGDKIEKLIEYAMPMADHLGGVEGLRIWIESGKIEIQPLQTIRGRDIKNSIIYCTEFQNNTESHAKLLIGRVGEGSELWLNGDLKQADKEVFRQRSGLIALAKLKGKQLFGQAVLDKTERSETAEMAELLD